jgi:small subunit ribosomal protein S3Ae
LSTRRKKTVDKWKGKDWYMVKTPSYFGGLDIGETMAGDPEQLIGRRIETTLYDITNDFNLIHIKLLFQITEVRNKIAYTEYRGHVFTRDYLRSLIRRGSSRVDGIFSVTTKDGYTLRLTAIVLTLSRAKTTQQYAIRKIMEDIVNSKSKELTFQQFVQQMVLGKLGSEIYNNAKRITALRKCDIMKSKVIRVPEVIIEAKPTTAPEAAAE